MDRLASTDTLWGRTDESRIATVSKRTGALGPFILRSSERTTAIDREQ